MQIERHLYLLSGCYVEPEEAAALKEQSARSRKEDLIG